MKKYKGFNVPDVGEFVSEKKSPLASYCFVVNHKCEKICNECLFGKKSNFEVRSEFIDWHNARLKGVKNGMV